MRRSDPYERYARHYDAIGQSGFGARSIASLLGMLESQNIAINSALDVACGTGVVAVEMAKRGINVFALDRSPAMLERAASRAFDGSVAITLIEADMTAFSIGSPVDLCTCFYDAVNYLETTEELVSFARSTFSALRPGGVLAFDINTIRKLSEVWDDVVVIAADDDERFLVYRSFWDQTSGNSPLQLTGFERRGDGAWERFDEEHVEHGFAIADVLKVLRAVGYDDSRVYRWGEGANDSFDPGAETDFRVLFVARRPDERSLRG
jgi:SAM-dependent methyltransferase